VDGKGKLTGIDLLAGPNWLFREDLQRYVTFDFLGKKQSFVSMHVEMERMSVKFFIGKHHLPKHHHATLMKDVNMEHKINSR
jgi:hypothetical protein